MRWAKKKPFSFFALLVVNDIIIMSWSEIMVKSKKKFISLDFYCISYIYNVHKWNKKTHQKWRLQFMFLIDVLFIRLLVLDIFTRINKMEWKGCYYYYRSVSVIVLWWVIRTSVIDDEDFVNIYLANRIVNGPNKQ